MPQANPDVVRSLWATLDRDPEMPWPPTPEEFDRRMRTDLCDAHIEIKNPAEFPVAGEYHTATRGCANGRPRSGRCSARSTTSSRSCEVDPSTIVSVQTTRARMRHTELETRFRWAVVWTLKDGKALSAQGFLSRAQALEAAGVPY